MEGYLLALYDNVLVLHWLGLVPAHGDSERFPLYGQAD